MSQHTIIIAVQLPKQVRESTEELPDGPHFWERAMVFVAGQMQFKASTYKHSEIKPKLKANKCNFLGITSACKITHIKWWFVNYGILKLAERYF